MNRQVETGGGGHRHPSRIGGQGLQHRGLDVVAVGGVVFGDQIGSDTDIVDSLDACGEFIDDHGILSGAVDDDGCGVGRQGVAGDHFHGRCRSAGVAHGVADREGHDGGAHGKHARCIVADAAAQVTVVVVRGRCTAKEGLDFRIRGRGAVGIGGDDGDASRRGDLGRRGVDGPVMAGRAGVGVAGGIGSAHAEAVTAFAETAIGDGIGAIGIGGAIQSALEGGPRLIGRDIETGIRGCGRAARRTVDAGFRRCGIDTPLMGASRGGIHIACRIDGAHPEVVVAFGQARIGLRAGAGAIGAAVQRALEGGSTLIRREFEGGAGLVGRATRTTADGGIRRG